MRIIPSTSFHDRWRQPLAAILPGLLLAGAGCSVTGAEGTRAAERAVTAAADVSAEVVVAEAALQRAPGRLPVAAFDGSQYLVVWEDYRSGGSTLYAGRVGLDGAALDGAGIPLLDIAEESFFSSLYEPVVAFDGTNFLVVTLVNKQIHGIRVSGAGEVLDPGGFPIFTAESLVVSRPAVVFDGTQYVVAWARGGVATDPNKGIFSARVKPDGTVVDPDGVRAYPMAIDSTRVAISFDGTSHLLSWVDIDPEDENGNTGVFAARIDADGQPLDQAGFRVSPSGAFVSRAISPAADFDGTNHVILWQNLFEDEDGFVTLFVMVSRVGTDGQIRDPQGIVVHSELVETTDVHRLDIAAGGGRSIVTWSMDHGGEGGPSAADIQVAQVAADGTVSAHPANKLARGLDATLVPYPTGALMLWREGESVGARYTQLVGTMLDPAGAPVAGSEVVPARTASMQNVRGVATDGETFFVVWADTRDVASEGKGLYGARISRYGVPLDDEGILLTTGVADVADVVFDGANFVVIWTEHTGGEGDGSPFHFVRVTPAGEIVAPEFRPSLIASPDYTMAAASDGTHTLLVGEDATRARDVLSAVLVDQDGVAASQTVNIVTRDDGHFLAASAAVSFDGSGYLVVWNDGDEVFGQLIAGDGARVGGLISIVSERGIYQSTAAFGGGNHLVLWQEAGGIFAKRVTPEGQVLDTEGKLITQVEPGCTSFGDCCAQPDVSTSACPSLVFDGTSFLLAWRAPTVAGDATSLDLQGAEITPDGDVLSTFPISEDPAAEGTPFLAVNAGKQVLAAYARFVPGAPFDTRQARARLLGPVPEPEPGVDAGPTPTPDAGPVEPAPDAGGNPVDPPPGDGGGCGGCTAGDSQPTPVASLLLAGIVLGLGLMRRRSAR